MDIIKFGKHKGKTYDDMLQNEKSYCSYVLSQSDCDGFFKEFQDFIKNNKHRLYNVDELKNRSGITCSYLSEYMQVDENVNKIISNLEIMTIHKNKIKVNNNIEASSFGLFIDYLIRYEISKIKGIKFSDNRTDSEIKKTKIVDGKNVYVLNYASPFVKEENDLQNLLCVSFGMNIEDLEISDDIEEADEEFIHEIINGLKNPLNKWRSIDVLGEYLKKGFNGIKTIVDNYINKINEYKFIEKSYNKLQNNDNVQLYDVLNVSIAHSLYFHRYDETIIYKNYNKEILDEKSYSNIINYIKEKVADKEEILLNPILGNSELGICADADLIIDNEIIDIKVSKSTGTNKDDFIQLLIYAALYYVKTKKVCNCITIYNPVLGIENSITIDMNIIGEILTIITNYGIGTSKEVCRKITATKKNNIITC